MTGFELQTSGIGSDCSTNWATTTAQLIKSSRMFSFHTEAISLFHFEWDIPLYICTRLS